MCRVEYPEGSPGSEDVIQPAFVSSNGDTWAVNRYQMKQLDDGTEIPTGRTERVDQLTECRVQGDEDDDILTITGNSSLLRDMGLPEDDLSVTVRVIRNPAHV